MVFGRLIFLFSRYELRDRRGFSVFIFFFVKDLSSGGSYVFFLEYLLVLFNFFD